MVAIVGAPFVNFSFSISVLLGPGYFYVSGDESAPWDGALPSESVNLDRVSRGTKAGAFLLGRCLLELHLRVLGRPVSQKMCPFAAETCAGGLQTEHS